MSDFSGTIFSSEITQCDVTTPASFTQISEMDAYRFEVVEGEKFIMRIRSEDSTVDPEFKLFDPNGNKVTNWGFDLVEHEALTSTITGTYYLIIQEYDGNGTGNYNFSLQFLREDCATEITQCDVTTPASFTQISEMDAYRFEVVEGEKFIMRIRSEDSTVDPEFKLFDPNGNKVTNWGFDLVEHEALTSTITGTYYLIIQEYDGNGTGNYNFSLQFLREDCATEITQCDVTTPASFTQISEMDAYRFEVLAGEKFIMRIRSEDSTVDPEFKLFDPDGNKVTNWGFDLVEHEALTSTITGTYYLIIQEYDGNGTGNYNFSLQFLREDCATEITQCDVTTPASFTQISEMDAYRFEVVEGEKFIMRIRSEDSTVDPEFKLFDPDGNKVTNWGFDLVEHEALTSTITGTYYLIIQEYDGNGTGNYNFSLQFLREDCATEITQCDVTTPASFTQISEMDAYRFEVVEGEKFIMRIRSGDSTVDPEFKLFDPDGNKVTNWGFDLVEHEALTSTITGTYYLIIQEYDGNGTGNYNFSLQFLREDCATLLSCNSSTNNTLSQIGEIMAFSFTPVINESFEINLESNDFDPEILVFAPNNTRWITWEFPNSTATISETTPINGVYYIIVQDYNGDDIGDFMLSLTCETSCIAPTITNVTITQPTAPNFNNGQIIIEALGTNIEYSIDGGSNYQESNTFTDLSTGNYSVRIRNTETGCFEDYTQNPIILEDPCIQPNFNWITTPSSVCQGSEVELGIVNAHADFNYQLFQNDIQVGDLLSGSGEQLLFSAITINNLSTFSVRAILKENANCFFDFIDNELDIDVGNLDLAVSDISPESRTDNNGRIDFCINNGIPPFLIIYEPNRGSLINSLDTTCLIESYSIEGLRAGFYQLSVTDITGCQSNITIKVDNPDKDRVGFPEKPLLTPNNDGFNDILVYDGLFNSSEAVSITIYDRFGGIVYQIEDYKNDWTGNYMGNGNPVPDGTYFYTLTFKQAEPLTGFITIIR